MNNDINTWHRRFQLSNEKNLQLSVLIGSWVKSSGFTLVGSQSENRKLITFSPNFANEPDYILAGLLFGELTHSLRSILDNIAYYLVVRANPSQHGNKSIAYPIYTDELAFDANVARLLPSVDNSLIKLIKSLQPFTKSSLNPTEDSLLLLHRADIWDKHRIPIVCALLANTFSYSITEDKSKTNNEVGNIKVVVSTEPVLSGSVVAQLEFEKPFQPGFTVESMAELQYKVLIEESQYSIRQVSESISSRVSEIINTISDELVRISSEPK